MPRKKRTAEDLWNHDEIPVPANTLQLSCDRKHVRWDTAQVQPAPPLPLPDSEPAGLEVPEYFAEDASLPHDDNFPSQESSDGAAPSEKVKLSRKRYANSVSLSVACLSFAL